MDDDEGSVAQEPGRQRMVEEFRQARQRRMVALGIALWEKTEMTLGAAAFRQAPDGPKVE